MPVPLLVPSNLGTPVGIFTETLTSLHGVTFIYDTPQYGRVVVQESQPDTSLADWKAANKFAVSMNGQPNVYGTAEIASVRSGLEAQITTDASGKPSIIDWRDDGGALLVIIKGPTLSRDDCIGIANGL
jgi:hypothetical protein